jgi:hypothetical protein
MPQSVLRYALVRQVIAIGVCEEDGWTAPVRVSIRNGVTSPEGRRAEKESAPILH